MVEDRIRRALGVAGLLHQLGTLTILILTKSPHINVAVHRTLHYTEEDVEKTYDECQLLSRKRDFDLVLPVQLVVVQRVLRHRRTPLVDKLHERNILLRGDHTHLVQVGVLRKEGGELVFRNTLGQVL